MGRGPVFIEGYNERKPKPRTKLEPRPRSRTAPDRPATSRQTASSPRVPAVRSVPVEVAVQEIPPQAVRYVQHTTWELAVARARYDGCETLAKLARSMLVIRTSLHSSVAKLMSLPFPYEERQVVVELVERLPLGVDDAWVAAARGVQLTGLFACVSNGRPLSRCACYLDIVEHEVKPMVKRLLSEGAKDWTGLAQLSPSGL
jgi:hypothetical protein